MTAEPQAIGPRLRRDRAGLLSQRDRRLTLAIVALNGWNGLAISMRAPVDEYVSPRIERPRTRTPPEHHRQGV